MTRREFLKRGMGFLLGAGAAAAGGGAVIRSLVRGNSTDTVWQIDPYVCVHCGSCANTCVLKPSAVKAVHAFDVCGYCDLCSGYLRQGARRLDTGAESQICPTGAIKRTYIEDPYFEYRVDEDLCIGCSNCARACRAFGNGSLFVQIRHDRCLSCNECACARACPAGAIKRVPRSSPYILKGGRADA